MTAYEQGFIQKCAECGLDVNEVIKQAQFWQGVKNYFSGNPTAGFTGSVNYGGGISKASPSFNKANPTDPLIQADAAAARNAYVMPGETRISKNQALTQAVNNRNAANKQQFNTAVQRAGNAARNYAGQAGQFNMQAANVTNRQQQEAQAAKQQAQASTQNW